MPRPGDGAPRGVTLIPGDGIGPLVTGAVRQVMEAMHAPVYFETYEVHGDMPTVPAEVIEFIRRNKVCLKGGLATPVGGGVSSLNVQLRKELDLYAALVNCFNLPGLPTRHDNVDIVVIRENTEGEYSNAGGRMFAGTDREFALQETIMTRYGVDRILKFAFDLAQTRPKKHLTSATKSNGISITMPYWDERVKAVAEGYPDVRWDQYHIDILTAHFVLNPDRFDVVVASNLFGDILSDLGPACTGTIGIAPSGNINPERVHPSVFEPVHGSAPDIAGQGIANPIGQIWSGAMMLEHLGEHEAAREIVSGIERVLSERTLRTRDLGGNADTQACGKAVAEALG